MLRRQFPGVRYALIFLKCGGLALVLETLKDNQHHFETNKMGREFLWERPTYIWPTRTRGPDCVNKFPPTMELANIKERISRIDPVGGMENWEIRIEG